MVTMDLRLLQDLNAASVYCVQMICRYGHRS